MQRAAGFVAGVVLAAGGSTRLGRPKQLLPYGDGTLLGHVVATARDCTFDQLLVIIGASHEDVHARVDLSGAEIVINEAYRDGSSSSLIAALDALDPRCDVVVLLLGDMPGVSATTVMTLLAGRGDAPLAACRYDNGRGHPFALGRTVLEELRTMEGDKGIWRLMQNAGAALIEVPIAGPIPRDVNTEGDYEAVLRAVLRDCPLHEGDSPHGG